MKLQIFLFLIFSISVVSLVAQNTVLEKIEEITWFENSGFAGNTVIFYHTSDGLLKAIRQMHGFGVPVVSSEIFDVEIKLDTVYLVDGLNLVSNADAGQYVYVFDERSGKLMTDGEPLEIQRNEPVLYVWSASSSNITTKIDLQRLKKLEIGKQEIYRDLELVKTFVE